MNDSKFMNDSEQELLVSKFLKENKFEVENIDFSRKVMRKIRRLSPEIITYLMSFIGGVICCVLLFTFRGEQIIYNTLSKFIAIWLKTADKITLMSETQVILSAIGVVLTFIVIIYQLKSDYKIRT